MAITPLPSLNRTSATFRDDCNNFFGTSLPAFVTEANSLASAMNGIAAGTAVAIPYTFSTTTTDADPGAGYLRLSNATQNASTIMRLDLTGADGSTWTSVLDTFDDSTSTIKGHIMLQKLNDATKWMLFAVTALASPTGYKNLTVSCVSSSAVSPFLDGDSLILKFSPKGDKGDVGSSGLFAPLAVLTPTAAANVEALSVFTSSYDNYLIIGDGILPAVTDTLRVRLATGGVVDSGANYGTSPTGGSVTAPVDTSISIGVVLQAAKGAAFSIQIRNVNSAATLKTISTDFMAQDTSTRYSNKDARSLYFAANTVSGIQFSWSSGNNFAATGKIYIYGYSNTL